MGCSRWSLMGLWYNLLSVEMPVRRHPEDELFGGFCRKTLEERALDRPTRTKSCFCSSPSEERVRSDWPTRQNSYPLPEKLLVFFYPKLSHKRKNKQKQPTNSWFSRDVTKILKSKPGGLQKSYLHLRKDYLKIYSCTIP